MDEFSSVSVVVTTFERPHSLSLVLRSLACQDYRGSYEVIVADDGSCDETELVARQHRTSATFPIRFVTHARRGFELARCRNDGARASRGSYLIFLDGDCIAPPNFISRHLKLREQGAAVAGFACHLDQNATNRCNEETIVEGRYQEWVGSSQYRKLNRLDRKSAFYRLTRNATKPRLRGGNFGVWRSDYQKVNGFDESFIGWGCEDDDLGIRLRRAGIKIKTAYSTIPTFHLWHPVVDSVPMKWQNGANVGYLHREVRWTRCMDGMEKRRLADLRFSVNSTPEYRTWIRELLAPAKIWDGNCRTRPDIEVLIGSEEAKFEADADCNVLVMPPRAADLPRDSMLANVMLSDHRIRTSTNSIPQFPLNGFRDFLATLVNEQRRHKRKAA